jgi:hypothetical protein
VIMENNGSRTEGEWTNRERDAIVLVMVFRVRTAPAVEKWLDELRQRDPAAGELINEAIARLRDSGPAVGSPLVVKVAEPLSYPGQPAAEPPRPQDDPRETLDYAYQRQLEMLTKVRRGVADVATSRKRVELQVTALERQATRLGEVRREALESGQEDRAAAAAAQQAAAVEQLGDLRGQFIRLEEEERKLMVSSQRLQAKVDAFRTRHERIKASYDAAEAQLRASEALSGITDEFTDVLLPGEGVADAGYPVRLLELRPGAPDRIDVRILFAIQPPDTVVLLTAGGQRERLRAWYDREVPRAQMRFWAGPDSSA